MGIILLWLVFAFVVGWGGTQKGRSFWFGFLWSVVLSPLVGLLIVLLSRTVPQSRNSAESHTPQDLPSVSDTQKDVEFRLKQRGINVTLQERQRLSDWLNFSAPPGAGPTVLAEQYEKFRRN